jgi:RimJ/RimL family protein N-acetyltransferase
VTRLVTERLLLVTLTADEATAIRAGDRAGRAWADDYPSDGDAVVAAVIGEAGEHYDESVPLGVLQVVRRDTGLAVGGIGFLHAVDDDGEAEVGYGLVESAQGQGYASEALAAVVALAKEHGVRRIVALTDLDNLPSQRVLKRAGFGQDGRLLDGETEQVRWALALD